MIDFRPYFATETTGTAYAPIDGLRGYRHIPEAEYHRLPAANASTLKGATPGHMLHGLTKPEVDVYDNDSRAHSFTLGRLAHWACLEPHKLQPANHLAHMVACPTKGLATKEARKTRDANPGKLLVTPEYIQHAGGLLAAIRNHPEASHWLELDGHNEASGLIRSGGVWRKWRADRVLSNHRAIVDVKTTRHDVSGVRGIRKWISECYEMGYFLQAAWYLHHHELSTGMRPGSFVFVVVSTSEPFHARCFEVENTPADAAHYHADMPLAKARRILGLDPADDGITRLDMFLKSARDTATEQAAGRPLTPAILRQLWPITEDDTSTVQINLPPMQ